MGRMMAKKKKIFEAQLENLIAETSRRPQINQKTESEDHILQNLVCQGNKLKAIHIGALVGYYVEHNKVTRQQQISPEIIRQSVDAEFQTIFD